MDWEASGSGDNGVPQTVSTPDGKPPKGKKKWPMIVGIIVVLLIVTRIASCAGMGKSKNEVRTFTWPTSGIATELPKPKTNKGSIDENSSESFSATLKEVSQADYDDYVTACKEADYTNFSGEGTDDFEATAPSGKKLTLSYDSSSKSLDIELEVPKDDTTQTDATDNTDAAETSADAQTKTSPAASSSDFHALMDGYEQFMNSYVEFMKKYKSSDDTASMLADYGSMMKQYSEWSQKFDSVDKSSLSAEDQAYYLEVQGRVLQKLSEIQ